MTGCELEMPNTFDMGAVGPDGIHRVAWTRGKGCSQIADRLAGGTATKIDGDLGRSCIRERIDTLVCRKLTGFDLVSVVVPHDVDVEAVRRVTAAVGVGPHSPYAVAVAARLGLTMDLPVTAATVRRPDSDPDDAQRRIDALGERHPSVEMLVVDGESAVALVDGLDDSTLLVVGAPGGSWFQRQVFGAGHRLQVAAPAGTLTVRSAPERCFHVAGDDWSSVVGPEMSVADARHVIRHSVVCVADHGELVGIVRRSDLRDAPAGARLADVMAEPVSVGAADETSALAAVESVFEGGPVPVVDPQDRIVGMVGSDRVL